MAWLDLGASYLNQKKFISRALIVSMATGHNHYVMRCLTFPVERDIESCHRLKGKGSKGRVILKLSKRKHAEKITLNKNKLKNIDHKEIELSSVTKVFINGSLCGYYKLLWLRYKKLFLEKKIASFWVTNGKARIKLLNDQVRSITHEYDLSALTHEGTLVSTDRNK